MKTTALWLSLLLACAPAFAKDRDDDYDEGYRKGFKEGYSKGFRDGQEAAAERASAPPAAVLGPILVLRADYGTGRKTCHATRWLSRQVNGKRSASVKVTNDICGDPAVGERKQLEVSYQCGNVAKQASQYEHRTLYLDCTSP